MGRAKGCRWKAVPLRVIPDLGQVSENSLHSPSKQRCDVLHDDEARSKLANGSRVLAPQSAAFAVDPSSLSGVADVLAGESAAKDVNPRDAIKVSAVVAFVRFLATADVSDVGKLLGTGEMAGQHIPAVGINLHLPESLDSRALESKVEPSNPRE